jgi:hypothetical protein
MNWKKKSVPWTNNSEMLVNSMRKSLFVTATLLLLSLNSISQIDTTKVRLSIRAALGAITDIERGDACKEREKLLSGKITLLESISAQKDGIINTQQQTIDRSNLIIANHGQIEKDLQQRLKKQIRIGRLKTVASIALPVLAVLAYSKLQ